MCPIGSPPPTRDWRGRGAARPLGTRHKQAKRVVWTAVALGLIGLLAWWLWPPPRSDCYLALLPIVGYDHDIRPAPYSVYDRNAWNELLPERRVRSLDDLQDSRAIGTVGNHLRGFDPLPTNTLLVWVSAHGVSAQGKAFLLCSDFLRSAGSGDLRDAESCRCELGQLLRQVQDCNQRLKLVLLDAGPIAADPRLGMIANEFPRLVEEEVRKIDDPRLWVFLSHGPWEVSHVSYAYRRSWFSFWLTEGLRGGADEAGDAPDRAVELEELYRYVRDRVAASVTAQSAGRMTQRPILCQGGKGRTDPPQGLLVLRVPRRPVAAQAKPAEAVEGAEPGSSAPPGLSPSALALLEFHRLLAKAWQSRDEMYQDEQLGDWTPADYAPHLWREYQELLSGYEWRYRYGMPLSDDDLDRLKELAKEKEISRSAVGEASVLYRLADAKAKFLSGEAKARFDQAPEELRLYADALRLKNYLTFAAPYYVRWQAVVPRFSSGPPPQYAPILDLLRQLPPLVELLESMEEGYGSNVLDQQGRSDKLRESVEALKRLRAQIEAEGFLKESAGLIENVKTRAITPRIEALLAMPLLPAKTRMALIDVLCPHEPPAEPPEFDQTAARQRAAESQAWNRLLDRARLEAALAALADPQAAIVRSVDTLQAREVSGEALWTDYRTLGKQFADFYRELPGRIAVLTKSHRPAAVREAGRLLRMVDARDALRKLKDDFSGMTVHAVGMPAVGEMAVQLDVPKSVTLSREGEATPLPIAIVLRGRPTLEATLTLIAPSHVMIEDESGQAMEKPRPGMLKQNRRAIAPLRARARDVGAWTDAALVVRLEAGGRTWSEDVRLTLAPPDIVHLLIRRVTGRLDAPATPEAIPVAGSGLHRVRAFPGRTTEYQWALRNDSGRSKKVSCQFWALPLEMGARDVMRGGLFDELQRPLPGFVKLTDPIAMELPAGARPQPIPFPSLETQAKKEAEERAKKSEASKTAGGKSDPGREPVLSRGMVCLIREPERKRSSLVWLEFTPVAPREYVEPEVAYDAAQGRITIRVRPAGRSPILPPVSMDRPISLAWEAWPLSESDDAGPLPGSKIRVLWDEAGKVLKPQSAWEPKGSIQAADQEPAVLYGIVEPGRHRELLVGLTVDDYPRAFLYRLRCGERNSRGEPVVDPRQVKITVPVPDQAYRVVRDAPTRIPVKFHVDAPTDAFRDPRDAVEVGIDRNRDRLRSAPDKLRFHFDRQVDVRLTKMGPQGLLAVGMHAADFNVDLNAGSLSNEKVDLRAQLRLPRLASSSSQLGPEDGDSVRVVLDASPPIVKLNAPEQVHLGADLPVTIETQDLSGVEKMEFGYDLDRSGKLDQAELVKPLSPFTTNGTVLLPAKEQLKIVGQTYLVMVRVMDRVGFVTEQKAYTTVIAPPPVMAEEPAKPDAPAKSTIEGRLVAVSGKGDWVGGKATVEELGETKDTDGQGNFSFPNVPQGKYTVQAQGIFGNKFHKGSAKVTVKAEPAKVEVPMSVSSQ